MISRLPSWVWAGAWLLAFVAGIINVVGLLGFEHEAITHLTGTTSMLSAAVAAGSIAGVAHFSLLLGSFVFGCLLSGFIVQDTALQLGRRYGVALLLVSGLLFLSVPLLRNNLIYGMYCAACACGIQNAMVSTYSGAVVRTTHLSGMFTDLGIFLGHLLRGIPVDMRRIHLCATVISGFFVGGIFGALSFARLGYATLLVPATLTAAVAISYALYKQLGRR